MQIQIDEQKRVLGYSNVGGFANGVDAGDVPEEFQNDFWPGKWKYESGVFEATGEENPETAARAAAEKQTAAQRQRASAAEIAFVVLAQSGQLDEATITGHPALFAGWATGVAYGAGDIVCDDGVVYRCVQAHTAQADWKPAGAPAIWKLIGDPGEEWPVWAQPIGAQDAYAAGDKVTFEGERYTSDIDGNVWAPNVHGWRKQEGD